MLESCLNDIKCWASKNYLKLNDTKSKFLLISNKIVRTLSPINKIQFNQFEKAVKNLGFFIDSELTFNTQINKVCQGGFYLLRNLWKISSKLDNIALKIQLVQSLILYKIDY